MMLPESSWTSLRIIRKRVDLPQPLRPTSPSRSRGAICNEAPSRRIWEPKDLWRSRMQSMARPNACSATRSQTLGSLDSGAQRNHEDGAGGGEGERRRLRVVRAGLPPHEERDQKHQDEIDQEGDRDSQNIERQ